MQHKLKIIPLGGVGEIGKNMTVIEYENDILIIDCGLIFPDEEMPGIDVVIPDMTYLEQNKDRVRGMCVTHGHEDHIGAIPFAMERFRCPIYGTRFTNALIRHKTSISSQTSRSSTSTRGRLFRSDAFASSSSRRDIRSPAPSRSRSERRSAR